MHFLARLAVFLISALAIVSDAAAADKPFLHSGIAADAKRYETYLKANWKPDGKPPAALKSEAEKVFATDPRAASRALANAVAADDKDSAAWTRLAEALLAIKADPNSNGERYDLPIYASGAAYRGYERANDVAQKAHALFVLGRTLEARSYWRPAIDALSMSLALADDQTTREAYDRLRGEYGFRMTDYKTDNDATPPRLCLQFSEDLSRTQTDVAKFISVGGKDPQNLVQDGKQLCLEGLKHGERYEVQIRAGLPSDIGETLLKTANIAVYVPDRSPAVHFGGKAYVLPSRGQQGIPVITTNTNKIDVEVYRIGDRSLASTLQAGDMARQLSSYDVENIRDRSGIKVYEGQMEIASKLNEEVSTAVPVTDATGKLEPGVYVMVAKPSEKQKEESYERATQWFIVSDLGLTAFTGNDGIHALVRSLTEATAIAGTAVKLIARNNEVLATATTDDRGYAKFDAAIAKGEGGTAPAVLVAQKGEGEYAFLDLTLNAFDLSDRGVQGRDPSGPVDAYVYTERGVYRGGEDVNVTALVRDQFGKASAVPMTLMIFRPDGVEQTRLVMNDQGLGGRALAVPLAKTAMTGTWRLRLYTDPKAEAIAEKSFLVEDFVPERLDMTLSAANIQALTVEDNQAINAEGRYLYGPPAAGLGIEGEVVVRASNKPVAGYAGYVFGQADELVNPARQPLDASLAMDNDGKAAIPIVLPQMPKTPKPLEAAITVKLREDGGRTIERNITLPVDLKLERIGIKPLFENFTAAEDQNAGFEVVLLDANGKPKANDNLTWTLTRLDTNWQWYRRDGTWTYEAVTVKRKVGSGTLAVTADGAAKISQPIGWGRYRLDLASNDADGPASSVLFNAGWYTAGDNVDSPEQLDVALDKDSYKSGETAKLRIASKLGGKALIAVLGTGLHQMKEVDIAKGGGEVEIPVDAEWGPGTYATAILYRPMDEAQKRMPSRAIGVRWLPIDQSSKQLKVAVTLPEKVKSGSTITVPLKVDGLAPGEDARVVVAAVDLGILNLTRYETPAPEKYFSEQQKLAFEIRDFYGKLIDGMRADRGKLRSGGDGGVALQGNPTVETIVSLFSGLVQVKEDGTANVEFELPDFNGTVRVMAVAWSKDKVGHGSGDLIVRDSVALTVAAPRFMTLGDEVNLGFSIHNIDGAAAPYKLTLSKKDGDDTNETLTALADKTADLKTGERTLQRIAYKPADIGPLTLKAVITGPNDISVKREMTFEVLPPAGDIKRTTISSLKPGGKLLVTRDLAQDMIASRTRINLSVGPAARLDVPTLLAQLDRYPYGCAEQTVSRAMPLVVANAVAAQVGLAEDKALKDRVQGAIARVFEMQDSTGAFGVWGPSTADLWLTAYVTDFLTRAKEAKYDVPREGFNRALDKLQNFIAYASDFEKGGEDRAYALYVLARNGRAPIGDLRYYADERIARFSTPLAKAQVGAALAMMGDKERAERAFAAALAAMPETPDSGYRSDYGSTLRDGAALVTLAAETHVAHDMRPKLANVIAKAYETRSYTSTQEQAWMLLAAKALNDEVKATALAIDGKPVNGPLLKGLKPAELKDGALTITNDGEAAVDAVISVIGAALTPELAAAKGFKIERQAYTPDGKKVDLASLAGGKASVKQNDRFVMTVKVTPDEPAGRVLVVDRLPAGFEIENPHLIDSGAIAGLSWLKSTAEPEHTEFRDDRFVAAFNFANLRTSSETSNGEDGSSVEGLDQNSVELPNDGSVTLPDGTAQKEPPAVTATLAYIVRAVNPGTFVHPAATVEDMYRPERYARSAAGQLTVSAKE